MTIDNEQLTIKESLRDKLKSYIVFIGFTWQFDKLVFFGQPQTTENLVT